MYRMGQRLYAAQIVTSSIVPVLISILGSFPEHAWLDTAIRILAIVLSIVGTLAAAIESVYHYKYRGQQIRRLADNMNSLFNEYDTLSGPKFANEAERTLPAGGLAEAANTQPDAEKAARRTHGGLAFRIYSEAFNELQDRVRDAKFLTAGPGGGEAKQS